MMKLALSYIILKEWSNILLKSHTARFLKYVWTIFNIMHESVKQCLCLDKNNKSNGCPLSTKKHVD